MPKCDLVGYQNVGLADGTKMVGSPFITISQEGLLLEELIPTGYEENSELIEMVLENEGYLAGDEFSFYIATQSGKIAAEYGWVRSYDESESKWNDDGEWVKVGGATDITILTCGEGVYSTCNWFTEGCGFMTAGEALVEARNIPFKDGIFIMSNPLSASVDLVDMWPVGYENNSELIEMVLENEGYLAGDEFSFYSIRTNGKIAAEYGWVRSYDEAESKWNDDGEWVKVGGASDIESLASGEAIYATCNWFTEGCAMSFPGIDDKHLDE